MTTAYFNDPRLQLADCHLYSEHCNYCRGALFWLRTAQVLEAGEEGFDPFVRYDHLANVLANTFFGADFGPLPAIDVEVSSDEGGMASDDDFVAVDAYGRAWRDVLFAYVNQTGVSPQQLLDHADGLLRFPARHRRARSRSVTVPPLRSSREWSVLSNPACGERICR
jgi:hypothetical protein